MTININLKICLSFLIIFCFSLLSCCGQENTNLSKKSISSIVGKYQKEDKREVLIINNDSIFICLRVAFPKFDAIVPSCDTIAAGYWEFKSNFLVLRNKKNFNSIKYAITESKIDLKDSIRFKIILPEEGALNYKIFHFIVTTSSTRELYNEFSKPEFSVRRSHDYFDFGLIVNNIAANSLPGRKSYQRNHFYVFENYRPRSKESNMFTIMLENFNQCFYEAMDVEGEVIGLEKSALFWRGNVYKKGL